MPAQGPLSLGSAEVVGQHLHPQDEVMCPGEGVEPLSVCVDPLEPDPTALRAEVDEGRRKTRLLATFAWLIHSFPRLGRVEQGR